MNSFVKATIVLTNRCNLRCAYCFVKKNKQNSLNKNQIETYIKWFVKQPNKEDYRKLNFFGGEPFLEFELLKDAVIFFKKNNIDKKSIIDIIPTNGTILTKEILDFVRKENLRISFSLDGEKISNFSRKYDTGENCFDKVLHNMKEFKRVVGYTPLIKMTVLPTNVKSLYANFIFLVKKGFYKIWPYPAVFSAKWEEKDVKSFIYGYKKILKFYLKNILLGKPMELVPVDDILINCRIGKLREHDFFCGLGKEPILAFDGNIYSCDSVLLGANKLIQRFKVGEIRDNKVKVDFKKMKSFQEYNFLKEHNLRNKKHFLSYLFRRRPCFAIDEKGQTLKTKHIENILEINLKIFELSLELFHKFRVIFSRNVKNIRIL